MSVAVEGEDEKDYCMEPAACTIQKCKYLVRVKEECGTRKKTWDNVGPQELCHFGHHSSPEATSPDETSEESDEE